LLKVGWSKDMRKISAGSADKFVYVWDVNSKRILYKLPGHNASVNEVQFHPKEPIMLSVSSDKQIYLGEIEL
jgi:Prp8 binding protein